jgi:acyl carrier protein
MLSKKGVIMNIETQVLEILKENIEGHPNISLHSDLRKNFSLDSFSTIMIINALEDDFNIVLEDAEFESISNASDIIRILREKYHVYN